jgi:cation transport regulator ChaC
MRTVIGPEDYAKLVRGLATAPPAQLNKQSEMNFQKYSAPTPPVRKSVFYFAYGSNMLPEQMKHRCPESCAYARGKLRDWEFMINERGVATLRKAPGGKTLGVIYEVTPLDLAYLDHYEGVKSGFYGRFYLPVEVYKASSVVTAVVYIDPSVRTGSPRPHYMKRVIEGAKAHRLPRRYIGNLKAWRNYDEIERQSESVVCLRDIEEGKWEPPAPQGD